MSSEVVLLEGDGIGPEITRAVLEVLEAAGAQITWLIAEAGLEALKKYGDALPEATVSLIREKKIALKAPISTPIGKGNSPESSFSSVNVRLRKALDLYANLRPARLLPGVKTRFPEVDLIFVRENTEGLYSGLELEVVPGVVTSLKVATKTACLRIAEFAFAYAKRTERKKVTAVHKANIMKLSDGLALECYRQVAARYPQIVYEERIVDATAMALVMAPERFDVLLMENLYGDILSDLGAGLVGGLGLAPSANYGENCAIFEAVHGSAPDIAGQGIANPTALLLSATAMLSFLGQEVVAKRIEAGVYRVLEQGEVLTRDLGGSSSTSKFAQAIMASLS